MHWDAQIEMIYSTMPTFIVDKSVMHKLKIATVSLVLCFTGAVQAESYNKPDVRTEKRFTQTHGLTRKDAARFARDATRGRVIAVKPMKKGGAGYNVRLLMDGGRVVTVKVDRRGKVHRK